MSNDETNLLELIYAEQQKQNQQFEALITTLSAGLSREVNTLGEGKRAWHGNSKKLLTELSALNSKAAMVL